MQLVPSEGKHATVSKAERKQEYRVPFKKTWQTVLSTENSTCNLEVRSGSRNDVASAKQEKNMQRLPGRTYNKWYTARNPKEGERATSAKKRALRDSTPLVNCLGGKTCKHCRAREICNQQQVIGKAQPVLGGKNGTEPGKICRPFPVEGKRAIRETWQ